MHQPGPRASLWRCPRQAARAQWPPKRGGGSGGYSIAVRPSPRRRGYRAEASDMRDMVMVGFLQAQNCSNFAGSWRHPDSRSDFSSPDYYAHIGRVLEAGKFQLAFFDDRLGMPEFHGGRFAEAVAHGIRCVKMDPIACLMPMAMAHHAARPRLDLLDDLLSSLPCGAAVPDARPDDARPRRLERRHLDERRRGAEHGAGGGRRARRALRPRRRVPGGRAWPLGHLGRRRADRRQDDGALRRPREGAPHRPQGPSISSSRGPFTVPRSPQGHPGRHPGRAERPRTPLRRALGRADLHEQPRSRALQEGLRRAQGRRRAASAAIPST